MDKKKLLFPLRLLVSGGLIVYLVWQADPRAVWASWQNVSPGWLLAALLLQFVAVAANAAKWQLQLRVRGVRQPYGWLLGAFLAGQFANNFLPTTIGGDALRVAQLGRRIGSYGVAGASVFFDRLTGFLTLSLCATLVLLAQAAGWLGLAVATPGWLALLAYGFMAVALAALVVAEAAPGWVARLEHAPLPPLLGRPLRKTASVLASGAPPLWALPAIMGMSLLYQALWVAMHVAGGLALGLELPLLIYVLTVPLTDIIGLAPIFFNNLGAREWIFLLYLTQLGVGHDQAIALSLLVFSVRLVVSLLGGLVVLFGGADLRARPAAVPGDSL